LVRKPEIKSSLGVDGTILKMDVKKAVWRGVHCVYLAHNRDW
jgi:hypothetical protein